MNEMGERAQTAPVEALRATRAVRWLARDASTIAQGLRFAVVGATSGLVFAAVTTLLVSLLGVDPKLASIGGYIVSMPANFIGNRTFSFRSRGAWHGEALRFCILHLVNMAVAGGTMGAIVDMLGLHYAFGIVGAIVLVPLVNFVLMKLWVFAPRADLRN